MAHHGSGPIKGSTNVDGIYCMTTGTILCSWCCLYFLFVHCLTFIVFPLFCFFYYQQYYLIIDNILDNDENPIVKIPLLISGQDGNLVIVEHLDDDDGPISMMMA